MKLEVKAAAQYMQKSSIFWDITPFSLLKVNQRFGGACRLHVQDQIISQARDQQAASKAVTCFGLASCLAYSSTVKMEAALSSETSVDFQCNKSRCMLHAGT
jgi:hypothetical protein